MNLFQKINAEKIQTLSLKTKNLVFGSLEKKIYFHHIPKCGGTSLNRSLQACYVKWNAWESSNVINLNSEASWKTTQTLSNKELPADSVDDSPVMRFREELLFYFMSLEHIYYISGHFPFSISAYENYSSKYDFITVLRDPVERWISSYFYNNYRQKSSYRKIDIPLKEYINSDFGRSQGCEYSKFLGGTHDKETFMDKNAIKNAKKNLHYFSLIGFLDNMDLFKHQFKSRYKTELRLSTLNKRPENEKKLNDLIDEKMEKEIQKICQPDIEVYNYALENFLN